MVGELAITRGDVTRRVLGMMRRQRFLRELPVAESDGDRPLVVCLESDRVSDAVRRVEAIGGRANVVVADTEGFVIVAMERTPLPGDAFRAPRSQKGTYVIHEDITMGMLIAATEPSSGQSATEFQIAMRGVEASVPSVHRVPQLA